MMPINININRELQEKVNQLMGEVWERALERVTKEILMGTLRDASTVFSGQSGSYSATFDRMTENEYRRLHEGSWEVEPGESYAFRAWRRASGPCCGPSRARLFGVDMARPGGDSTTYSWQPTRPIQPKEKLEYSDIKIGYSFATIEYRTPIPAKYLEIEGEYTEVNESKVLYLQE